MSRHPYLTALGQKIRAEREARGYSQDAFALEIGMDRTYYAGIERGERNVAALNLIKIAAGFGVDPGDLLPTHAELRAGRSK